MIPPSTIRRRVALALVACALGHPAAAPAATLAGRVELRDQGRSSSEAAAAIVYFVPAAGARPAAPVSAEIMTRNRQFLPRTVAVPTGSTIRFPNDDPVQHNVFSVSRSNRFDLGRYGKGRSRSQTLQAPGVVRVFCNVHRNMSATILVLDTPHHAQPGPDGRFELTGIPAGSGTLHVWHPRAQPWSQSLDPASPDPVIVRLEATLPAVPVHLDKLGRPYRDEPDETYR